MRRFLSLSLVVSAAFAGTVFAACTAGVTVPAPTPTLSPAAIATATESVRIADATISARLEGPQIPSGTLVEDTVAGPISAVFHPDRQATEYVLPPAANGYSYSWKPVPCGSTSVSNDNRTMTWVHAHPPCDETTGHDDVTIKAVVGISLSGGVGREIYCEYQGASTGSGQPCVWGAYFSR